MRHSTLSRLMVMFLVIVAFICVFLTVIYFWSVNTVRSEITKSADAQASYYLTNLAAEIGRIRTLQYDGLSDINLHALANNFSILSDYEMTTTIIRLQQRLTAIYNSSGYIEDVVAYIPSIGKTISGTNNIAALDEPQFERLAAAAAASQTPVVVLDDALLLTAVELPAFWAACNRLGIMVSVDFMMACAQYPEEEAWFIEEMRVEAAHAIKELRNYPSLMFWCGDNELALNFNPEDDYFGKTVCALVRCAAVS